MMIKLPTGTYSSLRVLIFAIIASLLGFWGWNLAHQAFTQPPPASQVFAAVFVRDPAAHVTVKAEASPDAPWDDSLTISEAVPKGKPVGWLLLIECPASAPSLSHAVHLFSETAPEIQSQTAKVTAYSGVSANYSHKLDCFTQNAPPGTPGYPPSLGNVALPALQTDQEIEYAQAAPTVYAQQGHPGGAVHSVFQIFPGAVCPTATAVPVPTASTPAAGTPAAGTPAAGTPAAGTGAPSASPSATPSSQPSASSPGPPASPDCYHQAPRGTEFIPYALPTSPNATEILSHVNIQGYQVNSMFPVGVTVNESGEESILNTDESITWSGNSALSPSLDVTNTAAGNAAARDTFWAGIIVGTAAGTAVTFFDKAMDATSDVRSEKREKRRRQREKRRKQREKGSPSEARSTVAHYAEPPESRIPPDPGPDEDGSS
jgi:hypothetical protein